MIKEQRYEVIRNYLDKREIVLIEDLANELNIPLTTLRRDINELVKKNLVLKHHGGVESIKEKNIVTEDFLESKVLKNVAEKEEVARKAISKIKMHESIFIDAGSNGYFVAKMLDPKLDLMIVTNSISNVYKLAENGHKNIYLLGGKFKAVTGAITGFEAIEALKNYNFDKSFIGVNVIDEDFNIYTTSSDHAQIKIEIIKHSQKAYGLADSSKYNSKSFYRFGDNSDLELIS
ncbi:DeoR/GlpR family DNA-binding transcription regulator [[Acholeplasma] multilocale]|uniref:DeoR/GlpR family DNA-binding transcription regulator n=1 Tax=[Acholeplasma] multilocale TaxID=264638 RepID=UPI0004203134|nr:DeoR/GlpR family DNA-binding transcription regulator [[Acholeplasma] multilocale]